MAASKPTSSLSKRPHILSHLAMAWGPQPVVWALSLSTTELSSRSLTARDIASNGIRSLVGFGNLVRPLAHSVLYLRLANSDANPKVISGKTSYFRARLAFHCYPQLIREFFNIHRFGPPRSFTCASSWPWIDRPVSGPRRETHSPYSDSLSLRLHLLRFNLAPHLDSPAHSSIGTQSGIPSRLAAQRHSPPTACMLTVSGTISLALQAFFSPFPHGTCSLSVT